MRTKTVDEWKHRSAWNARKSTPLSSCDLTTGFYLKHSFYIYIFSEGRAIESFPLPKVYGNLIWKGKHHLWAFQRAAHLVAVVKGDKTFDLSHLQVLDHSSLYLLLVWVSQHLTFFLNITYLLFSKKFFFVYGVSNHKMLQLEQGNSACAEAAVPIAAMRTAKRSCTQGADRWKAVKEM